MHQRAVGLFAILATFAFAGPLAGQRPIIGVGIGGGVILGSQLVEHGFTATIDGEQQRLIQQVDLNETAVFSAHVEWYATSRLALRVHGAWGGGDLEVATRLEGAGSDEATFETGAGDVSISAYDIGISFWPWAPNTVGFAPFITVGIGRFSYDFGSIDNTPFFQATGERSEQAFLIGVGAELSLWRSLALRVGGVNHLVDSPLRSSDFATISDPRDRGFGDGVSNVRLVIGGHVYFPFLADGVQD